MNQRWDADTVRGYMQWLETPKGAFAVRHEQRLLHHMVSGWPRRGHTLLEVGCGPGVFLESFWEAGFDVTGLDSSEAMLEAARERMNCRADFHLGVADHLPFDDDAFDYVALLTSLEFMPDPAAALAEAFRVASRGVLVGFLNRVSPYYPTHGLPVPGLRGSLLRQAHWFSIPSMYALVRGTGVSCSITMRSVLHGPACTWRESRLFEMLNGWISLWPFGAYVAMRMDFGPRMPVTPLVLRTGKAAVSRMAPGRQTATDGFSCRHKHGE